MNAKDRLYAPHIVTLLPNGKKKYVRWTFSTGEAAPGMKKKYAVSFYQSLLLSAAMGYYNMAIELRVVPA
jgi:hypothetical protein